MRRWEKKRRGKKKKMEKECCEGRRRRPFLEYGYEAILLCLSCLDLDPWLGGRPFRAPRLKMMISSDVRVGRASRPKRPKQD